MKKPKVPVYIANVMRQYSESCDKIAKIFLEQLGMADRKDYDWWWVEEHGGGVLCFCGGEMFVNIENVILAIEAAMDYDSFSEWYSQWMAYDFETGEPLPRRINLPSWLMGARPETNK